MIRKLGLSGFFLLHHELLELAREVAAEVRGGAAARSLLPPGRGRGSSVSSIVCYLTGLSHVDPLENALALGRFLNEDLTALPDIDLDFPRDVREVLIPRVHDRYGREQSALVAAFPTFKARGAIRELGKALGLPPGEIERVARGSEGWMAHGVEKDIAIALGEGREREGRWRWLAELSAEAAGLPRHLSQHSGGMIVSTRPLIDCCPVLPAAMEGRQMVQWDKDSCSDAGFLKIDLLGLGMLSAVERCVEMVARTAQRDDRPVADPVRRRRHLRGDPERRDDRGLPDREPRADGVAAAHAPGEPRRPDHPGGDRAAGADRRRGGQSLHRAQAAAAGRPRLRDPLRPLVAAAGAAGHAGDDHLPGPGARGGAGVRGLQRLPGRVAAAGDEPQALGGGDRGPPHGLRGGGDGAARRRRRGAGRARLADGRRLLGVRLSQGARGGVRAAGLPVDLAAGALRARVPVRAARRAADGVLSTGRAGPRGAAARDRDPGARRQRQRGELRGDRRGCGAGRAGLRPWRAQRRGRGAGGRAGGGAGRTGRSKTSRRGRVRGGRRWSSWRGRAPATGWSPTRVARRWRGGRRCGNWGWQRRRRRSASTGRSWRCRWTSRRRRRWRH